ncbi:MAG: pyrroline-5-carboxylate reductase [bacterium]|nr:pyrroline-5-carboxylate reductase [bacterium]
MGLGNMGRAIATQLQGKRIRGKAIRLVVHSRNMRRVRGARNVTSAEQLLADSDITFLCIKPRDFYQLPRYNDRNSSGHIIVSIMAGVRIADIKKTFPGAKVVRAMPNLPLQIGQGVIGWYAQPNILNARERKKLEAIFSEFGLNVPVQSELLLDAITAISGSGPAYVFLFASALIDAARRLGFRETDAKRIVMKTISGSIAYAGKKDNDDFHKLIHTVQSKGGTTEAALKTLGVSHYRRKWLRAIMRAYQRAQEISSYGKN